MFFSKNSHGFFVEISSHSTLVARTSGREAPMVVEQLKSCAAGDEQALAEILKELQPKRAGVHGYIDAVCGTYAGRRIVRRSALDPKRYGEPNYLNETVAAQAAIEAEKYTLAVVDASTGLDFDLKDTTKKEAVFVGMPSDDVLETQNRLLASGIYPEALELGTLATLGGLVDYMGYAKMGTPTLVLEIDVDSTESYIVTEKGVDTSRHIPQGLDAMIPVVQRELGLKDEEAARKLFYSNTFDFTGMGATILKRLLKELQSSIGFYEVQTGQSIGQLACTLLPRKLAWLEGAIAAQLGVSVLSLDFEPWLKTHGITFAGQIERLELANHNLGLFSLMIDHSHVTLSQEQQ